MTDWSKILQQLSQTNGIAGREEPVIEMIKPIIHPWVDEMKMNKLGSLIAIKKGFGNSHPKLMISTHIDEIGFIVSSLTKEGFVCIEPRGGIDLKILPGQMMQIHTLNEVIPAVVSTVPPHLLKEDERDMVLPYEKIILDPGLSVADAFAKIHTGDTILFASSFSSLSSQRYSGKAFDNRVSALTSMRLLEALQRIHHLWDIVCVFSSQEEVGARGARTAAYEIEPSAAIAIDVTLGDQPEVQEQSSYPLGLAIPVGIGPNFSKKLVKLIQSAASEEQIATVYEPIPYPRGTDAATIQTTAEGIPTALISIPLRYMHTPIEVVDEKDIQNTCRLLIAIINKLDSEHQEGFQCF